MVLVSGPTALRPPAGIELIRVETAEDMGKALQSHFAWSTVLIMAAAVADYRPSEPAQLKIKKDRNASRMLSLTPTDDILATLSDKRTHQILVGFAAETDALLHHAKDKLVRKGIDLIVANDVTAEGAGFGSDTNAAVLVDRQGRTVTLARMPKREMADRILDAIRPLAVRTARKPRP